MKVHFIYTKQPEDNWTIYLADRSSTDIDPRDPELRFPHFTLKEKYEIVLPYRNLFFTDPNLVSCDRKYIDDNTLNVFYVFKLEPSVDPIEFGKKFIFRVSNMENPIVSNYFNLRRQKSSTKYIRKDFIEDDNGNMIAV